MASNWKRRESFKYLGARVTERGDVGQAVQCMVVETRRAMGGIKKIFRNREMDMGAKRGLYESIKVPKALYGTETRGLKADDKKRLDDMEMKGLGTMYGLTIWDRQTSDRIHRCTVVDSKLSYRAEQRTLRWFGYMERMNDG